jgi:hypothetical protein
LFLKDYINRGWQARGGIIGVGIKKRVFKTGRKEKNTKV